MTRASRSRLFPPPRASRWSPAWAAAVLAPLGLAFSGAALAENPIGLYVGVGVGVSNVDNNNYDYPYGYNGGFHDKDAAWKVLVGVRPVPLLGAEIQYMDFGSGHGSNGFYGPNDYYDYGPFSHPKAEVLYGVGYLPLPLPFLDVYGKLGVAHLQTNISYQTCTATVPAADGGLNCINTTTSRIDQTNTHFAFSAGVQTHFQEFAFRAEYERIESSYGNPSAFMLSATWTF